MNLQNIDTLNVLKMVESKDNNEYLINIAFLIAGWILGLLGTLIIDHLKKLNKVKEIRLGIITEVTNIRSILVGNVFTIKMNYEIFDREAYYFFKSHIEDFSNHLEYERIKKYIDDFGKLSDKQFTKLNFEYKNSKASDASSFKTIIFPYLNSNISFLPLLDKKFNRFCINLISYLSQLNEEIAESRFFYEKTFDVTLSQENHRIIKNNLLNKYIHIRIKAEDIVKSIDTFIKA